MSIRLGLIGCGRMAEKHAAALAEVKGAILTAVSDIKAERMEKVAGIYQSLSGRGGVRKDEDPTLLIHSPELDGVVIAASSHLHGELAIEALKAGKHVLVEKPMALKLDEAAEMIRLSEERGRYLLAAHQLRYWGAIKRMKEILSEGRLGTLYAGSIHLYITRPMEYYLSSPWRGRWETDGGLLLNQGIHLLDLLLWMMGDVEQVYGMTVHSRKGKETEDAATGVLRFRSGASGLIDMNVITYPENLEMGISLFGEKGTLALSGPKMDRLRRFAVTGSSEEKKMEMLLRERDEEVQMYRAFVDAILTGDARRLIPPREVYRTLVTAFAFYASVKDGKPVTLSAYEDSLEVKEKETEPPSQLAEKTASIDHGDTAGNYEESANRGGALGDVYETVEREETSDQG